MRIGVVNDRNIVMERICGILISEGYEIAWKAYDGHQSVSMCSSDTPDMVLMDLNMPAMDGIEATRKIMAVCPCPVLVITSDIHGNVSKIFEAMGAGALDAVATPDGNGNGSIEGRGGFLDKISMIERLNKNNHSKVRRVKNSPRVPLLAIGSSTGGPSALAKILSTLPEDFPAAVIVVQHVDGCFSESLAKWLDGQTKIKIRLAKAGDTPVAGQALIAPGNKHLYMDSAMCLNFRVDNGECPYIPSVDVFFNSLSSLPAVKGATAVLLTGMGSDGAEGMLKLKEKGWLTIAQDKESSVVWGMPGVAVKLGAALHVLPIDSIGPMLVRHFNKISGVI